MKRLYTYIRTNHTTESELVYFIFDEALEDINAPCYTNKIVRNKATNTDELISLIYTGKSEEMNPEWTVYRDKGIK